MLQFCLSQTCNLVWTSRAHACGMLPKADGSTPIPPRCCTMQLDSNSAAPHRSRCARTTQKPSALQTWQCLRVQANEVSGILGSICGAPRKTVSMFSQKFNHTNQGLLMFGTATEDHVASTGHRHPKWLFGQLGAGTSQRIWDLPPFSLLDSGGWLPDWVRKETGVQATNQGVDLGLGSQVMILGSRCMQLSYRNIRRGLPVRVMPPDGLYVPSCAGRAILQLAPA